MSEPAPGQVFGVISVYATAEVTDADGNPVDRTIANSTEPEEN